MKTSPYLCCVPSGYLIFLWQSQECLRSVPFLCLAEGILIALFTILAVKMKIRLTAFSDMTAVVWSDNCARPSMAIAGVLFANAVRHFIDAKKYNE